MRIRPYGEAGALVELDRLELVPGLLAHLRRRSLSGVWQLIPAARTLLIGFDSRVTSFPDIVSAVAQWDPASAPARSGGEVVVPVRYDGEDLDEVARRVGLPPDEVTSRHSSGRYTVAFTGFAPGFGYLAGLDPALHLPRRSDPRTRVRAGTVAIAGEYTGVYPRDSPGGWHVIGHTDLRLWAPDREPPALLSPGTSVQFVMVHR